MLGDGAFAPVSLTLTSGALDVPAAQPAPETGASADSTTYAPAAGGLLAVAANTNPGWTAEQDGTALTPVVVDGWRLGWRLDGDGPVRTRFGPETVYRAGLLAGGLLLAAFVLGVGWAARRRSRGAEPPPPLTAWAPAPWTLAVGAVVVSGLLAGWPGAVAGVLAVLLVAALPARASDAGPAGRGGRAGRRRSSPTSLRPWGAAEGWAGSLAWPHYLVVAACVLALSWSGAGDRLPPAAPSGASPDARRAGRAPRRPTRLETTVSSQIVRPWPAEQLEAADGHHRVQHDEVDAEDAVGDVAEVAQQGERHRPRT